MIVGVMTAQLSMQGISSLKGKRSIGIAIVTNDSQFIDKQFDAIITFMRNDGRFYLGRVERETF